MNETITNDIEELRRLMSSAANNRLEQSIYHKALKRLVRQVKRDTRKLEKLMKPSLLQRLTGRVR